VNSHVLPQYLLEWPQYHHDYQRTGLYNWTGGFGGGGDKEEFSNFITLTLAIRDTCYMEVTIYDSTGKVVKNLVAQKLSPGKYHPVWYGKDNNNNLLANGLYYIILRARGEQKVLLVRIKR
jgi:flagellar hook assembly protein FlgD